MGVTEGDVVAKTKAPIKAMPTKAKAKKAKGRTATKKQQARKKTAPVPKKKPKDTKKPASKKKQRIDDINTETTKNRRSNRHRNNKIFNYDELSHGSTIPSEDEMIPYNQQRATTRNSGRRGNPNNTTSAAGGVGDGQKRGESSGSGNNNEESCQWEIYDRGIAERYDDDSWNEQYRRLQEFHSTHGHSGVPVDRGDGGAEPGGFAFWVSRQRQVFREIRSGYRIASAREENRWKRLRVLGFPVNYEAWHWQRSYNELCEALNGRKYDEAARLPRHLSDWVHRQASLMDENAAVHGTIDPERKSRLEQLGVIARDELFG